MKHLITLLMLSGCVSNPSPFPCHLNSNVTVEDRSPLPQWGISEKAIDPYHLYVVTKKDGKATVLPLVRKEELKAIIDDDSRYRQKYLPNREEVRLRETITKIVEECR